MPSSRFPFALSHPLSALLDKHQKDFTRADFVRVIEQKGLERITFHYTALDGKLKELKLPVAHEAQAESILAEGERVDGSSLFKGMVETAMSDLYVVPVYSSAFLNPFDDRSLDFVCRYFTKDGTPAPFAPDNILKRAADLFRKNTGLELHALGEIEFYLLSERGPELFPAEVQGGYHNASPFLKSGPIVNEILSRITQITGAVKYAHGEVGYVDSVRSDLAEIKGKRAEQLEVEFLPRPITDMADDVVLGRWLIRNIAWQNGYAATFTPKLEEGVAGTGLHFHTELRRDGKNIMTVDSGSLSEEAHLRLVPHQEAPTFVCWSDLNRGAMIRVPLAWANKRHLAQAVNPQDPASYEAGDSRQTVELRTPDGSALIHLLLAGIVMSADWAFSGNAKAPGGESPLALAEKLYVKGDIFANKELVSRLTALPSSCVGSSRILLKNRDLYERNGVFPPSVIDFVANLLQKEDDEFMNKKLGELPADERRSRMRSIMHKDIHRH
ncbi:MAG: glutamine synthetase beta-grasp domain-containing protein [Candidatus Aminicenantes bacterium]|nr:glutamine synthetase beta-grasp domain-containing protein [Candidatus Aminicenantes bacterium]